MKKTLLLLALCATAGATEIQPLNTTAARAQLLEQADAAHSREDYARSLPLYLRLAVAGDGRAMEKIGECYEEGEGVAQDFTRAREWYEKAGAAGSANGYWRIGNILSLIHI